MRHPQSIHCSDRVPVEQQRSIQIETQIYFAEDTFSCLKAFFFVLDFTHGFVCDGFDGEIQAWPLTIEELEKSWPRHKGVSIDSLAAIRSQYDE
jgi:hypothetical protein